MLFFVSVADPDSQGFDTYVLSDSYLSFEVFDQDPELRDMKRPFIIIGMEEVLIAWAYPESDPDPKIRNGVFLTYKSLEDDVFYVTISYTLSHGAVPL
jgi:hypothetical protein